MPKTGQGGSVPKGMRATPAAVFPERRTADKPSSPRRRGSSERGTTKPKTTRKSSPDQKHNPLSPDANYKILKLLESNPGISQREIAREMDISLGKVNYCLRALIEKGHVKARNFKNSQKKAAYLYLLTPAGVQAKARITTAYFQHKLAEYEAVKLEIEELRAELGNGPGGNSSGE